MTDVDRSPFRRFPWIQLVFCLACLSMTAWTWMRCRGAVAPYRWLLPMHEVTQQELACGPRALPELDGKVVKVRIRPLDSPHTHLGAEGVLRVFYPNPPADSRFYVLSSYGEDLDALGVNKFVYGRVGAYGAYFRVDARGNPGLSVAGIVVGAMGCFILGLYLRRWSAERKALVGA